MVCVTTIAQETSEQEQREQQIAQLIEQLGHDEFHVREQAQKELVEIGEPAISALEQAINHEDLEISVRAQEALLEINEETESSFPPVQEQEEPPPENQQQQPTQQQPTQLLPPTDPAINDITTAYREQISQQLALMREIQERHNNMIRSRLPNSNRSLSGNYFDSLGVRLRNADATLCSHLRISFGIVISQTISEETYGLQQHDVIIAIDGHLIESERNLLVIFGRPVTLSVFRQGSVIEIRLPIVQSR